MHFGYLVIVLILLGIIGVLLYYLVDCYKNPWNSGGEAHTFRSIRPDHDDQSDMEDNTPTPLDESIFMTRGVRSDSGSLNRRGERGGGGGGGGGRFDEDGE